LPRDELEQFDLADSTNIQDTVNWISQFGAHRKLSGSLVAYRLYRAGSIDKETWQNLDTVFTKMWLATRDDQRQKSRNQEGGPNYYIVRRYRVGGALLDLVDRLVAAGDLTTSKAGKVLGVKAKQVQTLLEARHHTGVHRPA
jgi:plasmid maintenance system antidote protein VapI